MNEQNDKMIYNEKQTNMTRIKTTNDQPMKKRPMATKARIIRKRWATTIIAATMMMTRTLMLS